MAESFMFGIAQNVLSGIAQNVLEKLGSLALNEVVLAWGVKSELQRLQNTLSSIQAVLLDAEEQRAKNHQLEDWLEKLKDVLYEIDDVLDEFEIKVLQQKVDGGSTSSKVCRFVSRSNSSNMVGHKIKEIRERLDQIADDKNKFNLSERRVDRPIIHREREMTHSFIHPSYVIGRVEDKEKMVNKLLMPSFDHETLPVIPIVGIGGLGKTTLAKMVYNDKRVVENFQLRMWVCVSEEFELKKLVGKIIESAVGVDYGNSSMEQLQIRLRNILGSKKYLLILDDVWNRELTKWIGLRDLLRNDSHGSKIVLTTRDHRVASIMGSIKPYNLKDLSYEESLSLFVKWAFKEGQLRTENQRRLMKIGEQIVRKCKGVPLAVRTLGSMLHMKSDEREWVFIRDNEIWELEQKKGDILPALRLSYDQLPSYLKPCFAYCSTYAKDACINSIKLISRWMAQGLIQSPNQNKEVELEDVGLEYIHELCTISFFQDVQDLGWHLTFKMHDLVHDLALCVAKSEYATIHTKINHDDEPNKKKIMPVSRRVRHVSIANSTTNSLSDVPSCLLQLNNLRTINFQFSGVTATSKSFVETCTLSFKYLRLLDLHNSCFETLPSSIGNLKHLRYLSLLSNRSIKSLPNSICDLVCLQTLLLEDCERLEMLPIDVGKLISLRHLELTTQERCLSAKWIFGSNDNCLTSLRHLKILKCSNLESLFDDVENGMRHTSTLRTLMISGCPSLFYLPRGLRYLTALENLLIYDCENLDLMFDAHSAEDVVQTGQRLWFRNLPKLVTLPRWLLQGSVCNTLKHIRIGDCPNFATLPDWMTEDLKSLQKLWISNCPQLKSLPKGMHRLTTLEEIRILNCPKLMRRCNRETGEDWHEIAHVPHIYLNNIKILNT